MKVKIKNQLQEWTQTWLLIISYVQNDHTEIL